MISDKQKALLKKIAALAKQGTGGEKTNAQKKLKELMQKLNISLEDLEETTLKKYAFKYKRGNEYYKKLFVQILSNYLNIDNLRYLYYSGRNEITVGLITAADAVEIKARYDFYIDALKKDFKLFYRAFIDTNKLYDARPLGTDESIITEEELEFYMKAALISNGLDQHQYLKQLEQKEQKKYE